MFDAWGDYEQTAGTVDTVPERHDPLPEGLAGTAPGAELGMVLASIDRDRLSGHDRVIVMQAWGRQVAHGQAELYASMTAVAEAEAEAFPDDDPCDIHDVAVSEVRAALTWTRRAAEFSLSFAHDLVEGYPEVWAALHRGRIDLPKARVIIDQACHLDRDAARAVADTALGRASDQTTGQLRAPVSRNW